MISKKCESFDKDVKAWKSDVENQDCVKPDKVTSYKLVIVKHITEFLFYKY